MRQNALGDFPTGSGCGAAWLARLLGVQEVPSSNLGSPTKFLKDLQTSFLNETSVWSPTGVQNRLRVLSFRGHTKKLLKFLGLSPPTKNPTFPTLLA